MVQILYRRGYFEAFLALLLMLSSGAQAAILVSRARRLQGEQPQPRSRRWLLLIPALASGLLPYYSPPLAVVLLVASAFTGAFYFRLRFLAQADQAVLGALLQQAARRTPFATAAAWVLGETVFLAAVGWLLLFLAPSSEHWGYWVALGIITGALVTGATRFTSLRQLYRQIGSLDLVGEHTPPAA
jgi:hypothetical protein